MDGLVRRARERPHVRPPRAARGRVRRGARPAAQHPGPHRGRDQRRRRHGRADHRAVRRDPRARADRLHRAPASDRRHDLRRGEAHGGALRHRGQAAARDARDRGTVPSRAAAPRSRDRRDRRRGCLPLPFRAGRCRVRRGDRRPGRAGVDRELLDRAGRRAVRARGHRRAAVDAREPAGALHRHLRAARGRGRRRADVDPRQPVRERAARARSGDRSPAQASPART